MDRKVKYRCVKDIECEVCHCKGMLQIISKGYYRIRHYDKIIDGKSHFIYHRNSVEYINGILDKLTLDHRPGHIVKIMGQNKIMPDHEFNDLKPIFENNSRNEFHQRILAFKA